MPAELHVRDGGVWRRATNVYVRSGGVWRDCVEVYVKEGGVWRSVFVQAQVLDPLNISDVDYSALTPDARSAWITFNTDGSAQGLRHGSISQWTGAWHAPLTASIGNSYWIRATLQAGQTPSAGPALGAWHQLSSARTWTYTAPGGSPSSRTGTLLFEIASDSGGVNVVGSKSATIFVARET